MVILTHDEFVKKIESVNKNIRVLGTFVNKTTKIKVECLIDGRVWDAPVTRLLKGVGCKACSTRKNGETHLVTPEQFRETVKRANQNLEILSDYVNARTRVSVRCLVDGHVWDAFPSVLYLGGCPECKRKKISNAKIMSHSEYVERLRELNPIIEVIDIYVGARTKIKVRCIKHDYVWLAFPSNLTNGQGCAKCKSEKMSERGRTHEEFVHEISQINPEIEVVGIYKNCDEKITVRCKKHNIVWESTGTRLLNRGGCAQCGVEKISAAQRLSKSDIVDRLLEVNPNIELVGDYLGTNYKNRFKCIACGNEWDALLSNIWSGCGCPQCASSKGEATIESILKSFGVEYNSQHTFDDCKNIQPLRFDFYIPSEKVAIEFQGEQHFRPVDFAGKGEEWANEMFIYGQSNDNIKREYCKANNITLIEIRYDEVDQIHDMLRSVILIPKAASE